MNEDESTPWPEENASESPDQGSSGGPDAPLSESLEPLPESSESSFSEPDPLDSPGLPSPSPSPGDAQPSTSSVAVPSDSAESADGLALISSQLDVLIVGLAVMLAAVLVTMFAAMRR